MEDLGGQRKVRGTDDGGGGDDHGRGVGVSGGVNNSSTTLIISMDPSVSPFLAISGNFLPPISTSTRILPSLRLLNRAYVTEVQRVPFTMLSDSRKQ